MKAGAGVRGAHAEHGGQLAVVEAGVELERDQLVVARRQLGERGADGGAAERLLELLLRRLADGRRIGDQRGTALAPAQLVERGVAGDPEQPRALAAAPRV